jgi:hypothetical protein
MCRPRFLAEIPEVLHKLFFQSFGYYRFDYWVTGNLEFEIWNLKFVVEGGDSFRSRFSSPLWGEGGVRGL